MYKYLLKKENIRINNKVQNSQRLPIPENGSMTIISKAYVYGGYLLHTSLSLTIRKQPEQPEGNTYL